MSSPFLGQIIITGFNFAPKGFALCNGQTLAINQNTALFSLLGTTFGGNGQTTFALPNLQGQVPIGQGAGIGLSNYVIGEVGGVESVTLTNSQVPSHTHGFVGTTLPADVNNGLVPTNAVLANSSATGDANFTSPTNNPKPLSSSAVAGSGGDIPHPNIQPTLVVNFCIALQGIFPSRN